MGPTASFVFSPKPEKGLTFWLLEIIPEDESSSEKPRFLALVPVAVAGFPDFTWIPSQENGKQQEKLHPLMGNHTQDLERFPA